jgi:type IV pilus assembly protein PilM
LAGPDITLGKYCPRTIAKDRQQMFFRSKKVIGLDVGSSSIKLAELDVSKSGATLLSFKLTPTPQNAMNSGEIVDQSSLAGAIRLLAQDLKSKRKAVSIGLSGMAVIVKKITMPKMDKKLLADQIRYEAEQYIPFDINHVSLAHHILSHVNAPETIDVLLVAAQNETVRQHRTVAETAGFECKVIDVNGFALANCFELNYGLHKSDQIGLLNFGASQIQFVVVSQGEVIFCRDISAGGHMYTNEISKALGVSFQEAEMLKLSAVARQEVPEEIPQIINSVNEMISEEVRSSVDFLSATSNGLKINRCLVTGGASMTTGLNESVGRVTGLQIETLNPFIRLKADAKKIESEELSRIAPFVSIAAGLGLRQAGDS